MNTWSRGDIIAIVNTIVAFLGAIFASIPYWSSIKILNVFALENLLEIRWMPLIFWFASLIVFLSGIYVYWRKKNISLKRFSLIKYPLDIKYKQATLVCVVLSLFIYMFGLFSLQKDIEFSSRELIYKGQSSIAKGQFDKANLELTRVIELNPNKYIKSLAFLNRGQSNLLKKNYTNALKDMGQAIDLNPALSTAYYLRGRIYMDQGDKYMQYSRSYFENAVIDFSQAISLDPNLGEAYYARGLAYSVLPHSIQFSKSDFKKVLEISKDYKLRQEASLKLKSLDE